MRSIQRTMASASISSLLWRAASSRSSLASPLSRSPKARPCPSCRSRRVGLTSPAFQTHRGRPPRPLRRPVVATAFFAGEAGPPRSFPSSATRLESSPASAPEVEAKGARPAGPSGPVPTVLLAGFLGSGKTTTLKHLLENNSGVKIGTIVNDVASVNIDAKLVSNGGSLSLDDLDSLAVGGVVELQNGCACCSLADELFDSVVRLTKGGEKDLDAIVVELSGVADPMAVRDNWEQARLRGHPATRLASLRRTVTLVDACTFGTDWMSWDAAMDREGWTEDYNMGMRNVPELLAEQVEAADLLLVNKVDLAGEDQVGVASGVARGLNGKAQVVEVEFGRVGARELLGRVLDAEDDDDVEEEEDAHSHSHEHDHGHSSKPEHDHEVKLGHEHSHEHSEKHDHGHEAKHGHDHEHDHKALASTEPDCTDTPHSHSHSHSHEHDSNCTDTSHSHSHDHKPTAADQLGITSFVYRTPVPFNSQRLLALLNRWPVPIKDELDLGPYSPGGGSGGEDPDGRNAFAGVLRSKGFCWMAPAEWLGGGSGDDAWRHDTAMYWSHAGKHFGITTAGRWWASLGDTMAIEPYFAGNAEEYNRIMREDWISEEWGDRRQELVFIGFGLDEGEIRAALDKCLCTEDEMETYRTLLKKHLDETSSMATKDEPRVSGTRSRSY